MSWPFDDIYWDNRDFHTVHPLEQMPPEKIVELAQKMGLTVEEMLAEAQRPKASLTCILCGQPSAFLTGCKGCGGGAWGWEFEAACGQGAARRRQQVLATYLEAAGHHPERVQHAIEHAYQMGGCLICPACWTHTVQPNAYMICPLYLLDERLTAKEQQRPLLNQALFLQNITRTVDAVLDWVKGIYHYWCRTWNTEADPEKRSQIAAWRQTLLEAAFSGKEA